MGKKVWVARDNYNDYGIQRQGYVIGPLKTPMSNTGSEGEADWSQRNNRGELVSTFACPRHFKRTFPSIRLKPGEGPIRVELSARVCEEGE